MSKTIQINNLDKKSFELLFKEYFKQLCFFARKFVSDEDASREIVHDVFINLWEKRDSIDPDKSIKSYLFTSVNNRCLNYLRDNKKFNKDIENVEDIKEISNTDFSNKVEEAELQNKINDSINRLPDKCKSVFIKSRFEGLKYNEISEKLGVSVKTVEAQMSKALKILREELKEYMPIIFLVFFLIFK